MTKISNLDLNVCMHFFFYLQNEIELQNGSGENNKAEKSLDEV